MNFVYAINTIEGGKRQIDTKIQAYLLHKSQVRNMRPPDMLKHFAAIRGYSSNVEYAEGFVSLRSINLVIFRTQLRIGRSIIA